MATAGQLEQDYRQATETTRARRMRWWHDARFGMFIHWGLYSQLGRHEWVMNRERIPVAEYERLAQTWRPKPRAARAWAALAQRAGMKYLVLTTKHHEGFLLWDSRMSDYNAARCGPGRDLVREYVEAAREFGLRVGFYYSLMDWHHPDGANCANDEAARRRFCDYTQGCVRELLSHYGKIDILWYDVPWPLPSPAAWESHRLNALARELQPDILINDRSQLPEDFGTPEEHVTPAAAGRGWEACLTFNGSWGWQPTPSEDWRSVREVLSLLRTCTAGAGNLLLNIGPKPDGTVPDEARERLTKVGNWLSKYGGAVYGPVDRVENMEWLPTGAWSRKGKTLYYWCTRWPGRELAIGGLTEKLVGARLFPNGAPLRFTQTANRLIIHGLPVRCPDRVAQVALLELKFRKVPAQRLGAGCVLIGPQPHVVASRWASPFVDTWKLSRLLPKTGDVRAAPAVSLADPLDWQTLRGSGSPPFVNARPLVDTADGILYFGNRFAVDQAAGWTIHLGHDGGAAVFVNRQRVFCDPKAVNPCQPGRSQFDVSLEPGEHEIVIAFDTGAGGGWGIFFQFEMLKVHQAAGAKPWFPTVVDRPS